ncbi:hypothetical protein GN244_ATG03678 [Phytophthora infestans]|uniref:Tudor-knot domain-containing protein n=1 Tax=Phytophthora infestans TaxID=4787 RepID=A0A833WKC1_PHYIN|nr:hypothetical protein GN244_ATG03678 [Phytophthora infestans]
MAASLPPAIPSTPATPSGSNLNTESKPTMTPSTGIHGASPPAKSGSVPALEQEEVENPAEASVERPVSSKSRRRRDRRSKPKPKPKKKHSAQSVGYYVDALDKKMLWGEARIIQCNLTTQKIKVHFVGWSKNYDLWTDAMSITAHGRYAPRTKDETVKSWDGDMHLFEDMLGTIEEATFTPIPVPGSDPTATLSQSSSRRKPIDKKKVSSEKSTSIAKLSHPFQPNRSHSKRKATVGNEEQASSKSAATTVKEADSNRLRQDSKRSSKRVAGGEKVKGEGDEKEESQRSSKRQKRETRLPDTTTAPTRANARPSKKKRTLSPDQLPLFRDLELDDGTVLDFSVQREEARAEREAMQSFVDKCALIWKKQLALSVH